jgi:effector-binding domain-containing protein
MNNTNEPKECCPRFEPEPWDGIVLEWENKRFMKERVCTFFYMPLNFGGVMKKVSKKLEREGVSLTNGMCLSEHTSKWNMNVYLDVERIIPNSENVLISGKYLSKVYEGDFKETGKWCKDFEEYAKTRSLEIDKLYMWYTTCPKCARKYGKNYVVILGQIKS